MNSFFNYFVSKQLFEDEEPPRTRNLGLIFAVEQWLTIYLY